MYGRTRSETKRIREFVEKTNNECVVSQLYYDRKSGPSYGEYCVLHKYITKNLGIYIPDNIEWNDMLETLGRALRILGK